MTHVNAGSLLPYISSLFFFLILVVVVVPVDLWTVASPCLFEYLPLWVIMLPPLLLRKDMFLPLWIED